MAWKKEQELCRAAGVRPELYFLKGEEIDETVTFVK